MSKVNAVDQGTKLHSLQIGEGILGEIERALESGAAPGECFATIASMLQLASPEVTGMSEDAYVARRELVVRYRRADFFVQNLSAGISPVRRSHAACE